MDGPRRVFRGEDRAQRASSLVAPVDQLQSVVRRTGVALERLHQLVMTRVLHDEDVELAERLNDELKPLIDALIHFEVRRG